MNALYPIDAIRIIEKSALNSLPTGTLMQQAGKAASGLARQILAKIPNSENSILVLAGPGNNGGDALEMAANLANDGFPVSVLLVLNRKNPSEEAKQAMQKAAKSPVRWEDALSIGTTFEKLKQQTWSLVVDGIFGIGLREGLSGNLKKLVDLVNNLDCPVLALD
ncbi:MAG: NAD(P)H-hydrate epimerase, partial [Oxalobacter sp.]